MTLGGKIMELFGAVDTSRNPNPVAPGNSNLVNPNNPGNTNPTVPGNEARSDGNNPIAIPAAGEGDKSPLAEFGKLWETADPKTLPKTLDNMNISLDADPAKLFAAAKNVDFTKFIPPALQDRIDKGDKGAILEAMSLVGQGGFATSAGATVNLVKAALAQQAQEFKSILPELLRNNSAQQTLRADNKFFENPAVSPLVATVEKQLLAKNPSKTAAEIAEMAKSYLDGFANEYLTSSGMVVGAKPAPAKGNKGETDWSSFFEEQNVA